jgi:hypothetical protein
MVTDTPIQVVESPAIYEVNPSVLFPFMSVPKSFTDTPETRLPTGNAAALKDVGPADGSASDAFKDVGPADGSASEAFK